MRKHMRHLGRCHFDAGRSEMEHWSLVFWATHLLARPRDTPNREL